LDISDHTINLYLNASGSNPSQEPVSMSKGFHVCHQRLQSVFPMLYTKTDK